MYVWPDHSVLQRGKVGDDENYMPNPCSTLPCSLEKLVKWGKKKNAIVDMAMSPRVPKIPMLCCC